MRFLLHFILIFILVGITNQKTFSQTDSLLLITSKATAVSFLRSGEYDSARKYYNESLLVVDKSKSLKEYFEIKVELAKLWFRQNKPDSSLASFQKIEKEIAEKDYFDYYLSYKVYDYQGYLYSIKSKNQASVNAFKKNLALTKKYDPKTKTKVNLARVYNNLATSYDDIRNLNLAEAYYDSAIINLRKELKGPTELEHVIYLNKGKLLKDFGFFDEALENLTFSLRLLDQLDPKAVSPMDRAYPHLYLGTFYTYRNESKLDNFLAIKYADSSRFYINEANPNSFHLNYSDYIQGEANINLGRYSESQRFFKDAINRAQKIYGPSFEELGYAYSMLGDAFDKEGLTDSAEYYLNKAVDFYHNIEWENSEEVADAHLRLAKFWMNSNNYRQALEVIQESLVTLIPSFKPSLPTDNPKNDELFNSSSLFWALQIKADVLEESFELDGGVEKLVAALDTYDKLINNINLSRQGLYSIKSKNKFFNRKYDVFEKAILVALKANETTGNPFFLERAFLYSESSKANGLSDRLSNKRITYKVPSELLEKENDLVSQINFLEKVLYSKKETDSSVELKDEIFLLKSELKKLIDEIKLDYPEYHNTMYNAQLDLEVLKEYLGDEMNLLEYFVGKDSTYVFAVSDDLSVGVIDNKELNQVEGLITSLRKQRYEPDLAYKLFKMLIGDHIDLKFDSNSSIENLVIIPDGLISTLPFEVLLTELPTSQSTLEQEYLLKSTILSYHYSANLLLENTSGKEQEASSVFTFAPEFSDGTQSLLATRSSNDSLLATSLIKLPFAELEASSIASLLGGTARLGSEATENNFRIDATSANILHVASHAILNDDNPLYSKLVFADGGGADEDGMLYAYELYNMTINSDLICLSACNTGLGKYYKGEGVMSLAHGFMYSGAQNVMMSLWSVPDKSTGEIMTSFYTYLKQGYGKAQALRLAKLDYLSTADNNTASPYFWSGFVFIGNVEQQPEGIPAGFYILSIAVVVIIIAVVISKKKEAKNLT